MPASDASGDLPEVLISKATLRKSTRRPAPSRSVLRSAPDSIVEPQAGVGLARVRIAAAVQAVNAADILRLCRWLL